MVFRQEMVIAGRTLSIETGKLAGLAHGAVTVRYGDTIVLATATASEKPREGIDFLPLTVDFEERLYAAGKIPGGFIRREGRPSEQATLTARLTDRPLRPLFPKGLTNDVQAVVTVLSADQENRPDILSIIGASAALSISPIPFAGPVGAVRVGYTNGDFLLNPTATQLLTSSLDLIMAGTTDAVVMVEAGAKQVSEEIALEAIRFGHRAIQDIIRLQQRLVAEAGQPKWSFTPPEIPEEVREAVAAWLESRLSEAIQQLSKSEREGAMDALEKELISEFGERFDPKNLAHAFYEQVKRGVRASILDKGVRPDGRDLTTIRPITCEAGVLPRTHGSGLFSRGQTQALTIATLGSSDDQQTLDGLGTEESKRFLHHYNMPPFSTGEARPMRGPGRREIGHGALAERALAAVIPTETEFPYTIRLVSEVLSSNGSTSMASVCGSTLALMDAGVPIEAPVSGIAMGLVTSEDGRYAILTDIQGMEDQLGDMDFKVAGTRAGITALQMDIKIKGLTFEQLQQALAQARDARLQILDVMSATIDAPRAELSPYAPRIIRVVIPVEKIGALIGPGGRNIRRIQEETGTDLDVEDDGTVFVCARDTESGQQALLMVERFTKDVEINGVYLGKVSRLTNFGAFVEILPGKEGLIRMSELAEYDVQRPEDVVAVGDEIMVMVIEIDSQGRVNLSRRAVLQGAAYRPAPRPPMRSPAGTGTRRPFSSSGEPRSSSPRSSTLGERRPPSYRRPQNRDDFRPPFEPRP